MHLKSLAILSIFLFLMSCNGGQPELFNISLKKLDFDGTPTGWTLNDNDDYAVINRVNIAGQRSEYGFEIEKLSRGNYVVASYQIDSVFNGTEILFEGDVETKSVIDGHFFLLLKLYDSSGLELKDESPNSPMVNGTTAKNRLAIKRKYDSQKVRKIIVGFALTGKGKACVSRMSVKIDSKSIERCSSLHPVRPVAQRDTSYQNSSGIDSLVLDKSMLSNLDKVCKIWGFLKYYHPSFRSGQVNCDVFLIRLLHKVVIQKTSSSIDTTVLKLIDSLNNHSLFADANGLANPKLRDPFHETFSSNDFPAQLYAELLKLRSSECISQNYYGAQEANGVIRFTNERPYNDKRNPDVGIRLLSLFRFWNMVNYYYPYRYLLKEWSEIPGKYIPKFVNAENATEYALYCLELVNELNDSHATVIHNKVLEKHFGRRILPFTCSLIDQKLVVTGFYNEQLIRDKSISVGDIIEIIDGKDVQTLVRLMTKYHAGSNTSYREFLMTSAYGYLVRTPKSKIKLSLVRDKAPIEVEVDCLPLDAMDQTQSGIQRVQKALQIIPPNIGLINVGKLTQKDLDTLAAFIDRTDALVIDVRSYPNMFSVYQLAYSLKQEKSAFARFTSVNPARPGEFVWKEPVYCGPDSSTQDVKPVAILVNSRTLSQAEFTVMALQTIKGSVTIGSPTAGADGDVTDISLPGRIKTKFSSLGVYYPSGRETQGVGLIVDLTVQQSISGIRRGIDEQLETAITLLSKKNKSVHREQ